MFMALSLFFRLGICRQTALERQNLSRTLFRETYIYIYIVIVNINIAVITVVIVIVMCVCVPYIELIVGDAAGNCTLQWKSMQCRADTWLTHG